MKKIILLALTAMMMVGCGLEKNNDGSIVLSNIPTSAQPYVVVIDSCEYISWGSSTAHKGNCRFCKERRKKEIKEMVELLKEK